MLITRTYEPSDDEILYHYCDANAFLSICTNKKIRSSDLYSMNDFLEMHWGYSIWEKAASELLDDIEKDFLDKIDEIIHSSGLNGTLVSSCYSLDGDVLSQWRAYADDGKGYVIGFRAKDLIQMPIRALKVLYNEQAQIEEVKNLIRAINDVERDEKTKFSHKFWLTCATLAQDLAAFKNPAFVEEQEVRMVHFLSFTKSNDFLKIVDMGGTAFGKKSKGLPVLFRMRDNSPVAFIEQDFTNKGRINPIKEVIIGPKNNVLSTAISAFLETVGIGSVNVKRSKASYR